MNSMTDKEKLSKLSKLADAMYYAAQQLTTDASRLHKAMDEYHQFIINEFHKEEPANEDLEEVSDKYGKNIESNYSNDMFDRGDIMKAFEDGAQWQKEQMVKDAVEVPIEEAVPFGSCKWKLCAKLWLDKGVKGNKVKLIIIKED